MTTSLLELEEFLPYRLSYTANLVSELIAGAYETLFGLTIPQWRVMAHTAKHDGISQQEICQRARMDKVTISRAAIALIDRGLLARSGNPSDRRSHLLVLTEAGRTLFEQIAPKALELEQAVFGRFERAELKAFYTMLRRLDAAALGELDKASKQSGHFAGQGGLSKASSA